MEIAETDSETTVVVITGISSGVEEVGITIADTKLTGEEDSVTEVVSIVVLDEAVKEVGTIIAVLKSTFEDDGVTIIPVILCAIEKPLIETVKANMMRRVFLCIFMIGKNFHIQVIVPPRSLQPK